MRRRFSLVVLSLCAIIVLLVLPNSTRAQLTGSVSIGGQLTNNVQQLDTIAPDQILMPAFQLNYDVHPSGVTAVSLIGSYTPNFYNLNPGLSFQEISIGATGLFYLSNQDAIAAESLEKGDEGESKPLHSSHLQRMENSYIKQFSSSPPTASLSSSPPIHAWSSQQSKSDSMVDMAVSVLYTLSGELDSTEISPKGISASPTMLKARVSELEDLRDSISDVISTIADLLDSAGYSESTAEVIVSELQSVRAPLLALMPQTKPFHTDPGLLDSAIRFLQQAKPETDFLSTAPTPSVPAPASVETKQLMHALTVIKTTIPGAEAGTASAPNITLLTSNTRLRTFGYNDAAIHEDVDDSDATTMAAALTVPVAYTDHAGVHYSPADSLLFGGNYGGNPNDNKMLTFGAAIEGLTSTSFSLRAGYDYTHEDFPFDSVYSSTENRIALVPRIALGKTTLLIGEGAIGFKKYINPLVVIDTNVLKGDTIGYDTTRGPKGRIISIKPILGKTLTAQSAFNQFSYGIGMAELLGERWVLGGLIDFNYNPNLRAYVTSAQLATKKVRAAAQVADDEYTYNLGRYTVFSNARIFADLDFGLDFSYEHRLYGAEVGPKGAVLFGDSSRTENGEFLNASLSKLIPFEDRLIGVFSGLLLETKLEWQNVVSTEPIYSYQLTAVTLTATLTF